MTAFRYRAVSASGSAADGVLNAPDQNAALEQLSRDGLYPIEIAPTEDKVGKKPGRLSAASRRASAKLVAELGVLVEAGLPIDRALALALEGVERPEVRTRLSDALRQVREGRPLSQALDGAGGLLPSIARPMVEAGEANGRLGAAIVRLGALMETREELRATIVSAAIYPAVLIVVAVGVILVMLLFVIPQFETVFAAEPQAKLPAATTAILAASRFVRQRGLVILLSGLLMVPIAIRLMRAEQIRAGVDRAVLRLPQIGTIITYEQTAQLARTLGVLVGSQVDLPLALAMAQRALTNRHIAAGVAGAVVTLRGGGGLTAPLAASGVLPSLAVGFLRTGEETSSLGPMLNRLADVLEREVRTRIERLLAVLTPAVTVLLGGLVALVIASIMTAILGFNDLALG